MKKDGRTTRISAQIGNWHRYARSVKIGTMENTDRTKEEGGAPQSRDPLRTSDRMRKIGRIIIAITITITFARCVAVFIDEINMTPEQRAERTEREKRAELRTERKARKARIENLEKRKNERWTEYMEECGRELAIIRGERGLHSRKCKKIEKKYRDANQALILEKIK